MTVYSTTIHLKAKGFADIHDITPRLAQVLAESGLNDGIMNVILPGSTGAITTIEYEPGVLADLARLIEKLVPSEETYAHDAAWGDGNGFSHLRSALMGTSFCAPFSAGKLVLGTWQQVVYIDFDNRPRTRNLQVQLVGER